MSVSPSKSLKGWQLKVWAVRNIETFKLLGSALSGIVTFYVAALPQPWSAALAVLATVAGKLVLDALHFWAKEVELQ